MSDEAWTILADGAAHQVRLTPQGHRLTLQQDALPATLGWTVKDNTLCRADRCLPIAPQSELIQNGGIDLAALAALLRMPVALSPAHRAIALAESAEDQGALLRGGTAPDFALQDLAGRTHRLSDYRGSKVLLVTWASWCGCREDLAAWQAQYQALRDHGLTIVAISQDARREDAAPFIEASGAEHPSLLDPDHIVSHRYGFINVPTAVWIDEAGLIARPPRVEHASNMFQFAHGLDCEPHLAALRKWAETGETDFSPADVRDTMLAPTFAEQQARAHHALAWHLHQQGAQEEAERHWNEAVRLAPYDWTIRRGSMWLRGANPFGAEFAEAWMEWENAGRPDYASLAAARANGATA
jgi:peroxiredoxin